MSAVCWSAHIPTYTPPTCWRCTRTTPTNVSTPPGRRPAVSKVRPTAGRTSPRRVTTSPRRCSGTATTSPSHRPTPPSTSSTSRVRPRNTTSNWAKHCSAVPTPCSSSPPCSARHTTPPRHQPTWDCPTPCTPRVWSVSPMNAAPWRNYTARSTQTCSAVCH